MPDDNDTLFVYNNRLVHTKFLNRRSYLLHLFLWVLLSVLFVGLYLHYNIVLLASLAHLGVQYLRLIQKVSLYFSGLLNDSLQCSHVFFCISTIPESDGEKSCQGGMGMCGFRWSSLRSFKK